LWRLTIHLRGHLLSSIQRPVRNEAWQVKRDACVFYLLCDQLASPPALLNWLLRCVLALLSAIGMQSASGPGPGDV